MKSAKDYLSAVKEAVDKYIQSHEPSPSGEGFSVAAFEKGHSTFSYSRGQEYNVATSFPLASVSKPILSSLVTGMALDLQIDIRLFFPKLKTNEAITVSDLLNQKSGISEYLYAASEEQLNQWGLEEYCDFIQALPINDDRIFKYSNSNFVLLTQIIQILGHADYSSLLSSKMFQPLGLSGTFSFEDLRQKERPVAGPHLWRNGKWERQEISRLIMGYGDSSLFSSAADLGVWTESAVFKEHVQNIVSELGKPIPKYCMGFFCNLVDGALILSHSGTMPGAMSLLVHIPDEDFSMVYLSNYSPEHYEPLVAKLMGIFKII